MLKNLCKKIIKLIVKKILRLIEVLKRVVGDIVFDVIPLVIYVVLNLVVEGLDLWNEVTEEIMFLILGINLKCIKISHKDRVSDVVFWASLTMAGFALMFCLLITLNIPLKTQLSPFTNNLGILGMLITSICLSIILEYKIIRLNEEQENKQHEKLENEKIENEKNVNKQNEIEQNINGQNKNVKNENKQNKKKNKKKKRKKKK